jgi:hypothetical protein
MRIMVVFSLPWARRRRSRNHLHPAAGALFDIGIIGLGFLAIIPVIRLLATRVFLNVFGRRLLDYDGTRRVVWIVWIRVGITPPRPYHAPAEIDIRAARIVPARIPSASVVPAVSIVPATAIIPAAAIVAATAVVSALVTAASVVPALIPATSVVSATGI